MSSAFLFPGQGAQTPGFLDALPAHPAIDRTLETASAVLRRDARSLIKSDAVPRTEELQPAVLIAGVAYALALEEEGCVPQFVAGLSVGTYSAAVVAGSIAFEDALRVVQCRAELMSQSFPAGYGLAAVLGLSESRVRNMLSAQAAAGDNAYLAAVNAPAEIVLAGSDAALDAAVDHARKLGATHARRLAVAVPSHCDLLAPAALELETALADVPVKPPRIQYIGNRRARALKTAAQVREELATNLAHPILWHDSMTLLHELGATLFVEMPPGEVLTALARAAFPQEKAYALSRLTPAAACQLVSAHDRRDHGAH